MANLFPDFIYEFINQCSVEYTVMQHHIRFPISKLPPIWFIPSVTPAKFNEANCEYLITKSYLSFQFTILTVKPVEPNYSKTYCSEKTSPDFIQPIYTRGLSK